MRRTIIFALVYTLILTVPMLAVVGIAFSRPGEWHEFLEALLGDHRWPIFPIVLFWPWVAVMWSLVRRTRHA